MPRPKTKKQLVELSQVNYKKLMDYVASLPQNQKDLTFPPGYLNRNIRDVLAHLHHWHLMMLEWYKIGMSGKKPDMPAKGYTWKTVPELNREIWQRYKDIDFDTITDSLEKSYQDLQRCISKHTDTELFEKKYYPWTGSTSLGAYFISATSSHYDWALKLIRKCMKSLAH